MKSLPPANTSLGVGLRLLLARVILLLLLARFELGAQLGILLWRLLLLVLGLDLDLLLERLEFHLGLLLLSLGNGIKR